MRARSPPWPEGLPPPPRPRRSRPYEILGELGRGGMGVVYKAFHPGPKQTSTAEVGGPWLGRGVQGGDPLRNLPEFQALMKECEEKLAKKGEGEKKEEGTKGEK